MSDSNFVWVKVLQKDINQSKDMQVCKDYALDPVTNALKRITGRKYDIDRIAKIAFCRDNDTYTKRFLFEKDVIDYLNNWDEFEIANPVEFIFLVEENHLMERKNTA